MPRIAMICVHTSPLTQPGAQESGGMNTYVRELSRQLSARGVAVDVFTRRVGSGPKTVRLPHGERLVHITTGPETPLPKKQVFDHLPEFVENVERFRQASGVRYDLIHSHYWLSGWVGETLKKSWAVPHVTMFHTLAVAKYSAGGPNGDSVYRREVESHIAGAVDAVVAASPHEKALIKHMCGESDRRIEVIPCGVDLDLFRPLDAGWARAELGLHGKRVALFVGRLVLLKGIDILIEATARLSSVPDLQLLIVGGEGASDPDLQRLRWLAEELELEGRVRFEGPVEHGRLPLYYNAADVCVVPSHYESFGLVAIEALACGTPVIASQVGGLPSIVHDGRNGLLVPWRCPQVFSEKVGTILGDDALRARLRAEARNSVLHLTWGKVAANVDALYRSLLAGNEGARDISRCWRPGTNKEA